MAAYQLDAKIAFQERLVQYITSFFNAATVAQTDHAQLASQLLQSEDFVNKVLCGFAISAADLAHLLAQIHEATAAHIQLQQSFGAPNVDSGSSFGTARPTYQAPPPSQSPIMSAPNVTP
jgi:hypothetical protein